MASVIIVTFVWKMKVFDKPLPSKVAQPPVSHDRVRGPCLDNRPHVLQIGAHLHHIPDICHFVYTGKIFGE